MHEMKTVHKINIFILMILELMFFLYLNFILWHEVWLIVVCSTMFCWQMHELTMKLALQKSQNAELRSQFEGRWYIFHLSLSLAMGIFFFLMLSLHSTCFCWWLLKSASGWQWLAAQTDWYAPKNRLTFWFWIFFLFEWGIISCMFY